MAKRGAKKTQKKKRVRWWIPVLIVLGVFIILSLPFCAVESIPDGNIAVIEIEGPIFGSGGTSYLGSSSVSSESVVKFIYQAEENPRIEAILFIINSPGGSAVASDEIADAVKLTNKPTVAMIREVGASGGYWVASATDHVIANRMSITGSIGVISSYLEFSDMMDKYGVSYQRLVAGDKKDLGVPFQKLSHQNEAILQTKLDKIHDYFIDAIAENRQMAREDIVKVATGEFYLGIEAKELGLIDELGGADTVEDYLKTEQGIEEFEYVFYEESVSLFDVFAGVMSNFGFNVGEGIGSKLLSFNQGFLMI
jgi:protease IV